MKKVTLLHTVQPVLRTFGEQLRDAMGDMPLQIENTLDEFLASDANIHGFTQENLNRMLYILKAKDLEHTDVIVVTCSTLSPAVRQIRPFIATPVVCIDDAMVRAAVAKASRIAVMATADSTVAPTCSAIEAEAGLAKKQVEIQTVVCREAYAMMKAGLPELHDAKLAEAAKTIRNADLIVLAQASMAGAQAAVQAAAGMEALSSPALCIREVANILRGQ